MSKWNRPMRTFVPATLRCGRCGEPVRPSKFGGFQHLRSARHQGSNVASAGERRMMLPTNLTDALALLRVLLSDGNLGLGLVTLLVILAIAAVLSWVIVGRVQ